ncbi:hypothetical protein L0156_10025 [bacterium]|nr:hypothetical protein [bacterium]
MITIDAFFSGGRKGHADHGGRVDYKPRVDQPLLLDQQPRRHSLAAPQVPALQWNLNKGQTNKREKNRDQNVSDFFHIETLIESKPHLLVIWYVMLTESWRGRDVVLRLLSIYIAIAISSVGLSLLLFVFSDQAEDPLAKERHSLVRRDYFDIDEWYKITNNYEIHRCAGVRRAA